MFLKCLLALLLETVPHPADVTVAGMRQLLFLNFDEMIPFTLQTERHNQESVSSL